MSKILVSLVSEQTLPNVLFIRELIYNNIIVDKYYFISTIKMEENKKTQSIIEASLIKEENCKIIIVENDNLENIEDTLRKLAFDHNDKLLVNITCGTKIMSLGIYNFFKEKGAEIFYLSIGTNTYSKIYPYFGNDKSGLKYNINLQDYFKSYGININNDTNFLFEKDPQKTKEFFQFFAKNKEKYHKVFNFFRNNRDIKGSINFDELDDKILLDKKAEKNDDNYILDKLLLETFINEQSLNKTFNKDLCVYYSGGWFEEFVYLLLKERIKINNSISVNIIINRYNKLQNELDVCFVYKNKLFVIECKTGLKTKDGNLFTETIYKIAALKKDFGLDVNSFLFTLDDSLRDKNTGEFLKEKKDKADLFNIILIDKKILKDEIMLKKEFFDKIFI